MWNVDSWENSTQYNYTYDASNFLKTDSYKRWDITGTKVINSDSNQYYFQIIIGVSDVVATLESINVYPIPSSATLTIGLPKRPEKGTCLNIFNLNGQQLISRQVAEPITVVDIGALPVGVYIVKVTHERTVRVGKFVKQ
jgi:hypothetical protein